MLHFSTQGVTIFLYINRIVNFSTNIPPTINCTANTHYSLFGNHKKLPSEQTNMLTAIIDRLDGTKLWEGYRHNNIYIIALLSACNTNL